MLVGFYILRADGGDQFSPSFARQGLAATKRQPALVDNPTHLLLGPMFVMAKLFIALGFRRDLATIIQGQPQSAVS